MILRANLDANNKARIINVPDPVNPQDVATKAYVDANAGGGSNQSYVVQIPNTSLTDNGDGTYSYTINLQYNGYPIINIYQTPNDSANNSFATPPYEIEKVIAETHVLIDSDGNPSQVIITVNDNSKDLVAVVLEV